MWGDDEDIYSYECEFEERLFSLANYFGKGDIMDIASAGFSATENPLVVYCAECMAFAHDFDESDNLFALHKMISPQCSLIKKYKLRVDNFMDDVDLAELYERCKVCCVRCAINPVHCWPETAYSPVDSPVSAEPPHAPVESTRPGTPPPGESQNCSLLEPAERYCPVDNLHLYPVPERNLSN